jgi:hypothetical protein
MVNSSCSGTAAPYITTDASTDMCSSSPGEYLRTTLTRRGRARQPALNARRLHALEAAAGVLAGADRFGQPVGAAQAAVDVEPLRESPHAV